MIPLTDEETKSYEKQKMCYICKKKFCIDENDKSKFKLNHKVKHHCHYTGKFRGGVHICNEDIKYQKEIPVVFHNGSTYDYYFIIKQLEKEFEVEIECLGEDTEKYINFSVPIYKKNDNDKKIPKNTLIFQYQSTKKKR